MRRVEGQDPSHPVIQALRWILANRNDPKTGKRYSMRGLSESAGLQHSRVEQILGLRMSADVSRKLAIGLASAGGVRLEWFLTGEGPRDVEERLPSTDTTCDVWRYYPARDDAANAARRLKGVSEDAIKRVLTYTYPCDAAAQRISADEWYSKMKEADHDIQSVMSRERG